MAPKPIDIELMKQFLRTAVERKAGFTPVTSPDFERLAEIISNEVRGYISPTTLKRIWGYNKKETVRPRPSVLNIFANYLNYVNANEMFMANGLDSEALSGEMETDVIFSGTLPVDALVEITWYPDREIVIRHLHDNEFIIEEVHNSKVKKGATFSCNSIVEGRALILSNYLENGDEGERLTYECGRHGGISCRLLS